MTKKIKNLIKTTFAILFLSSVFFGFNNCNASSEEVFEARVLRIVDQTEKELEKGTKTTQQDLMLVGTSGSMKGKEFFYNGISETEVVSGNKYKTNDKVVVQKIENQDGESIFFVIDVVRTGYIYILGAIFAIIMIVVGRKKGVAALVGLIASFFIIVKIILPAILHGYNPLIVGLLGSFVILMIMIYLNEGWNRASHISIFSVLVSLSITLALSFLFVWCMRLTGLAQEETTFLINIGTYSIDFRGLLMTGILIGAIGVLDDIVVGQVEAIKQIRNINPGLSVAQTFKHAYAIGNTHLGAIINTLFLTYTGAALPLLLLFVVKEEPFISFSNIINNETIATEIVRTLAGSIGVALSMPIATYFAAKFLITRK